MSQKEYIKNLEQMTDQQEAKLYRILLILVPVILFLIYYKKPTPEPVTPSKLEQVRTKSEQANVKERSKYVSNEAKYLAKYKRLQADSVAAAQKDKQETEKAAHSAQEYAKTPTLDNCKTALRDCQEENGTKAAVITVQGQQIGTLTEQRKADSSEINRLVLRSDTLNQGWKDANAALSKQKGKRWALGVQAGYGMNQQGLSPYIGIGVQYTLIRW